MTEQNYDKLSNSEREALESLPKEKIPPAEIEDRVVSKLKSRNLMSPRNSWWRRPASYGSIAASLVILAVGVWIGRVTITPSSTSDAIQTAPIQDSNDKREFMLLLHEDPRVFAANIDISVDDLVKEYTAWARQLAESGVLTGGEKLTDETFLLSMSDETSEVEIIELKRAGELVAGYFSISVQSTKEALEISSTCPHLKYGGEIELREIDRR